MVRVKAKYTVSSINKSGITEEQYEIVKNYSKKNKDDLDKIILEKGSASKTIYTSEGDNGMTSKFIYNVWNEINDCDTFEDYEEKLKLKLKELEELKDESSDSSISSYIGSESQQFFLALVILDRYINDKNNINKYSFGMETEEDVHYTINNIINAFQLKFNKRIKNVHEHLFDHPKYIKEKYIFNYICTNDVSDKLSIEGMINKCKNEKKNLKVKIKDIESDTKKNDLEKNSMINELERENKNKIENFFIIENEKYIQTEVFDKCIINYNSSLPIYNEIRVENIHLETENLLNIHITKFEKIKTFYYFYGILKIIREEIMPKKDFTKIKFTESGGIQISGSKISEFMNEDIENRKINELISYTLDSVDFFNKNDEIIKMSITKMTDYYKLLLNDDIRNINLFKNKILEFLSYCKKNPTKHLCGSDTICHKGIIKMNGGCAKCWKLIWNLKIFIFTCLIKYDSINLIKFEINIIRSMITRNTNPKFIKYLKN